MRHRKWFAFAVALAGALGVPTAAPAAPEGQRDVMVVSNNWAGTADLVDPRTFKRLARIDVIPDKDERIAEITADPPSKLYFDSDPRARRRGPRPVRRRRLHLARRPARLLLAAELRRRRGDRPADQARSPGASRSTATAPTTWRCPPTGARLLVSASTASVVDVIDTRTHKIIAKIPSGDQPHESNFSRDGKRIFHATSGPSTRHRRPVAGRRRRASASSRSSTPAR